MSKITVGSNTQGIIRVGVLGAARIARKNISAIIHTSLSGCSLTAVASRSKGKAVKLVEDVFADVDEHITFFEGPTAYDDLISSTDIVDALYIPLPTRYVTTIFFLDIYKYLNYYYTQSFGTAHLHNMT